MSQRAGGIQIPNQLRSTFRSDMNTALLALMSHNSGAAAPDTLYDSMFWVDTTNGLLKMRDTANSTWIVIGTLNTTNLGLATLASPALTGTPTTPTAGASTNTTQIASTAFVQSAIANVPAWTSATLLNSWTNSGSPLATLAYRKHPSGLVEVKGVITKVNPSNPDVIFTLPSGYRPLEQRITAQFGTIGGSLAGFRVDILSNGNVEIFTGSTGTFIVGIQLLFEAEQ